MSKTMIHSNQFMIVALDKKYKAYAIASKPEIFSTYADALHTAQKWAGLSCNYKYLVVAVAAVAQAVENPVVVTTYEI